MHTLNMYMDCISERDCITIIASSMAIARCDTIGHLRPSGPTETQRLVVAARLDRVIRGDVSYRDAPLCKWARLAAILATSGQRARQAGARGELNEREKTRAKMSLCALIN